MSLTSLHCQVSELVKSDTRPRPTAQDAHEATCPLRLVPRGEKSTLLYVSHTTRHTTLHLNKNGEAIRQRKLQRRERDRGFRGLT